MIKLFKYFLLVAGTALLGAGVVHAKDEAKASPTMPAPGASSAKASSAAPKSEDSKAGDAKSNQQLMDINSASEKELASLPKIGEVRAKAIVKGRPYKGKDELVAKKILTQDAYDSIKDQIIAKQGSSGANKKK